MYVFYFRQNEDDIDLLFHLLRVYNTRQVISLHFLSRFLEDSVIKVRVLYQAFCMTFLFQSSSILYKRKIFFKFVEVFLDVYYLQELKAKILQYIILPMFAYTFEDGKVDEVSVSCIFVITFLDCGGKSDCSIRVFCL